MKPIRVYVHPDNAEAFRRKIRQLTVPVASNMDLTFKLDYMPIEIITLDSVPKGEPTGFYILRDGTKVKAEELRIVERFVTYGPEDLRYLIYSGKVKVEMQGVGYIVNSGSMMLGMDKAMEFGQSASKRLASVLAMRGY